MQFAMIELVAAFEKESDIKCDLIVTSSGKLAAQIIAGAPYDLFISADPKYTELLKDKELVSDVKNILRGTLVLWSLDQEILLGDELFKDRSIKRIAIPNPIVAPYGKAAIDYLENTNLMEEVGAKLIYGESVAQTNQFIMTRTVDAIITSKSSVLGQKTKEIGRWVELDDYKYEPIIHSWAIVNTSDNNEKVNSFDKFFSSLKGQNILSRYGYEIISESEHVTPSDE